jgi:hypothetical protein
VAGPTESWARLGFAKSSTCMLDFANPEQVDPQKCWRQVAEPTKRRGGGGQICKGVGGRISKKQGQKAARTRVAGLTFAKTEGRGPQGC